MSAPVFRMASGVRSSGSTLMPPVVKMSSQPAAFASRMAAVMPAGSSSQTLWKVISQPYSASLPTRMGVNLSSMRPLNTSLPVVMTANFLACMGSTFRIGSLPAAACMASIFSCSMTSGMMRVPASFWPFFTGRSPWMVAIIIWGVRFTASRASRLIFSRPSQSAMSSIFPSFGSVPWMFLPAAALYSSAAASSSWRMPGFFSQT